MIHIDLFSGIGGFALACQWAGIETVVFCEKDEYCQTVLRKHWPGIPIVPDIRDFKWPLADTIQPISWRENNQDFNHKKWGTSEARRESIQPQDGQAYSTDAWPSRPIILTGGFPCQPFSVAGKRRGKEDDRFLWPEMFRIIKELRPDWILAENVAGIVHMVLDDCLSDLEGEDYSTGTVIIPACAVNAPHRRDRVWIVGHSECRGLPGFDERRSRAKSQNRRQDVADSKYCPHCQEWYPKSSWDWSDEKCPDCGKNVPHHAKSGLSKPGFTGKQKCKTEKRKRVDNGFTESSWWAIEPDVGRVAHGVPFRVDRLKALGNAIVPQVAYQIIKVIVEIEDGKPNL